MRVTWKKRPLKGRGSNCCPYGGEAGHECLTPSVGRTRLPSIRSCCLRDPMRRAEWLEETERLCRGIADCHGTDCEIRGWDRAAARSILAELVKVVPSPTMPEAAEYEAEKRRRKREADIALAPLKAAILGLVRPIAIET